MSSPSRRSLAVAAFALGLVSIHPVDTAAQASPIRILVGFPAGGTIDIVARSLAEKLRADLGAPVIVESRPGAGGQLAAVALKQAAPDGRTLMIAPDHTMVIVPLTVKAPGFDPDKDFVPIGRIATYLGGFAVTSNNNAKTLAQFFDWTRANPTQASVGIPSPGSIPQFALAAIGMTANIKLTAVPYKGAAPLTQDLAAGHVPAGLSALGDFLPFHRDGKVRVLAVVDNRRSPLLPDVPTFTELGYSYDWKFWLGMFAPAMTPASIVDRTHAALQRALDAPDLREQMAKIFFDPAPGKPTELTDQIRAGTRIWAPAIAASGWTPQ